MVPNSTSTVQFTARQAGNFVHCGSAQSTRLVAVVVAPVVADLDAHRPAGSRAAGAVGIGAVDEAVVVVVDAVVADLVARLDAGADRRSSPDPRSRSGRCSCRPCRCCRSPASRGQGRRRAAHRRRHPFRAPPGPPPPCRRCRPAPRRLRAPRIRGPQTARQPLARIPATRPSDAAANLILSPVYDGMEYGPPQKSRTTAAADAPPSAGPGRSGRRPRDASV